MSSRLPDTSARRSPENLAILLREPFRAGSELLVRRFAERGHPRCEPRTATSSSTWTTVGHG